MAKLREDVTIVTLSGELRGCLYVGADGLPEVEVAPESGHIGVFAVPQRFTPSTFPAAWSTRATGDTGLLLGAWRGIQGIQEELRRAEREADAIAEQEAEWNKGRL